MFKLVDLPKGKPRLADNAPGFVRVGVIRYDLRSSHECRDEEVVSRGTASDNRPRLQPLQETESSKGHGGRESRAMEWVGDEAGEGRRRVDEVEEVVHVARRMNRAGCKRVRTQGDRLSCDFKFQTARRDKIL